MCGGSSAEEQCPRRMNVTPEGLEKQDYVVRWVIARKMTKFSKISVHQDNEPKILSKIFSSLNVLIPF
jgi:hypothetical protein